MVILHSSYFLLIHELFQPFIQVCPPLEEQGVADQLEPRRELEGFVLKHGLQFVRAHEAGVPHFVRVVLVVDIGFDEDDIVDYRVPN